MGHTLTDNRIAWSSAMATRPDGYTKREAATVVIWKFRQEAADPDDEVNFAKAHRIARPEWRVRRKDGILGIEYKNAGALVTGMKSSTAPARLVSVTEIIFHAPIHQVVRPLPNGQRAAHLLRGGRPGKGARAARDPLRGQH